MAKEKSTFKTGSSDGIVISEPTQLAWKTDFVTKFCEETLGTQREILCLLRKGGKLSLASETGMMPDVMASLNLQNSSRSIDHPFIRKLEKIAEELARY